MATAFASSGMRIDQLDLSQKSKAQLRLAGLQTVSDLLSTPIQDISRRTGGHADQKAVREWIRAAAEALSPAIESLGSIGDGSSHLTTGSKDLDHCLGGGIPKGQITEIVGESGAGKTQLCTQLCCTVQFPEHLGGFNGGVAYISTEGKFSITRLLQIAQAFVTADLTAATISDNVHVVSCLDFSALDVCVSVTLPALLQRTHQNGRSKLLPIKLVIVDSIAAPTRGAGLSAMLKERSAEINLIGDRLKALAHRWDLAVVCTNHVGDAFSHEGPDTTSALIPDTPRAPLEYSTQSAFFLGSSNVLIPGRRASERAIPYGAKVAALGLVWSNMVNRRIMLSKSRRRVPAPDFLEIAPTLRKLKVVFAPDCGPARSTFVIQTDGISTPKVVVVSDESDPVERLDEMQELDGVDELSDDVLLSCALQYEKGSSSDNVDNDGPELPQLSTESASPSAAQPPVESSQQFERVRSAVQEAW